MCHQEKHVPTKTSMAGLKNVEFEDALIMTDFGKYNYLSLLVCCVSFLAMGMELFSISFLATASACDLNITLARRGILTAMPLLGTVVSAYPWGYICDTKGRRKSLLWSMMGGSFFSILSSFSPDLTTFAVLKFMSSVFASAANACVYTMLGEFQPKHKRDQMLIILTSAVMCVSAINGVISYLILTYVKFSLSIKFLGILFVPWRLLVIILGMPLAISAALLFWIEETPKFLMSQGKFEESLQVLGKIYAYNTGNKLNTYPVESLIFNEESMRIKDGGFLRSLWQQFAPLFQKRYLKYTICLFYVMMISTGITNGYSMWMPYISNNFYLGLKKEDAYVKNFCIVASDPNREKNGVASGDCVDTISDLSYGVVIFYSFMNFVLSFLSTFVVRSIGKRIFLIGLFLFTGLSGIIINWVSNPIAGIILFIFLNYESLAIGPIPAFAVEIYPTYVRGMSVCLLSMVGRTGAVIATNILGAMFETNCNASFYMFGATLLSSAVVCFFLPNDSRKRNKVLPHDEVTKL